MKDSMPLLGIFQPGIPPTTMSCLEGYVGIAVINTGTANLTEKFSVVPNEALSSLGKVLSTCG